MDLPRIETITFKPMGGTSIDQAFREAIALAIEYECDVEFGFNDHLYKVELADLLNCVRGPNS